MQTRIDSSGANGAWVPSSTSSPSQNKILSHRAIKEELIACLRDEIATLEDRISWLSDELEERDNIIYRLQVGLPVSWDCSSCSYETNSLASGGLLLHDLIRRGIL